VIDAQSQAPPRYSFRNSSGSFAKFAAIRRAPSFVSIFAVDRRLSNFIQRTFMRASP
jgi:hypothetical protein